MASTTRARPCDLAKVTLDGTVQPRVTIDAAIVAEYAEAMAAGAEFPPIVVFFDGAAHWLADGFHRTKAAERLGLAALNADVRRGTRRDATLYAIGANQTHGLRRTNADKRKAVLTLLGDGQWRRWSDAEIGRRCGVSQPFVSSLRSKPSYNAYKIEPTRSVERNGRTYEMDTAAIGKRQADSDSQSSRVGEPSSRLAVHFSSDTPEHYTPQDFLQSVRQVFGDIPDLDPCSNGDTPNVAAHKHYTVDDDGLKQPWRGRVFMNPPYGREMPAWAEKVRREWQRGEVSELIALLPARTDTEWFNTITADTDDAVICFLYGRLTFVGNADPAPFPSMVVYFGPKHDVFAEVFLELGSLWQRPSRPREQFVNHE